MGVTLADLPLPALSVLFSFQNENSQDSAQTGSDTCPSSLEHVRCGEKWILEHLTSLRGGSADSMGPTAAGGSPSVRSCPVLTTHCWGDSADWPPQNPFCVWHVSIQHKGSAGPTTQPLKTPPESNAVLGLQGQDGRCESCLPPDSTILSPAWS